MAYKPQGERNVKMVAITVTFGETNVTNVNQAGLKTLKIA
jgi:hypothetical protein